MRPWQVSPVVLRGQALQLRGEHVHAQARLQVYLGSSNSTNAKAGGRGGVFRSMERTRPYCRYMWHYSVQMQASCSENAWHMQGAALSNMPTKCQAG